MGTYTLAYFFYAAAQTALAVWAVMLWRRDRTIAAFALLVPIATVVYDNLIIALGSYIGEGATLQALTLPRFAGHALFTPSWIIASAYFALRAGAFARFRRPLLIGTWMLWGSMVAIGLYNEVISYVGEFVAEGDVVYYTNVGRAITPPPPSLAMLLVVLVAGAAILWKIRWPWMLLGALAVLASQAVRADAAAFVVINSTEVMLSAALCATLAFIMKRERGGALPKQEV